MKYLLVVLFLLGIGFITFVPEQTDFTTLTLGYAFAFSAYLLVITRTEISKREIILFALIARLLTLFASPQLSDDIYRFIWDGNLLHLGFSPFTYTPTEFINLNTERVFQDLYPLLNSPDYYSIYPPFAQVIFYLSTFEWMNPSFMIKLFLLIAEMMTIVYGMRLLEKLGRNPRNMIWYALNPLIIIEIMGNLHFEGFMICFFVLFMYFHEVGKINLGIAFLALSISAKLIPLMFLPFFLFQWPLRKSLVFFGKLGGILLIIFSPVLFQLVSFADSLDLYFRKFEFNASVYYLLRELGTLWKGYNMIGKIGPLLAMTTLLSITYLSYRLKDFRVFCQWALLVFLLLSTTIHPWYLSLGILLSVFTKNRFFIFWSFLVVLSYSKYALNDHWYYNLVIFEYIMLAIYIGLEFKLKKSLYPIS